MLERRPKKKAIIKLASMEAGGDIGELILIGSAGRRGNCTIARKRSWPE